MVGVVNWLLSIVTGVNLVSSVVGDAWLSSFWGVRESSLVTGAVCKGLVIDRACVGRRREGGRMKVRQWSVCYVYLVFLVRVLLNSSDSPSKGEMVMMEMDLLLVCLYLHNVMIMFICYYVTLILY